MLVINVRHPYDEILMVVVSGSTNLVDPTIKFNLI
jgi:hypothetical protein